MKGVMYNTYKELTFFFFFFSARYIHTYVTRCQRLPNHCSPRTEYPTVNSAVSSHSSFVCYIITTRKPSEVDVCLYLACTCSEDEKL